MEKIESGFDVKLKPGETLLTSDKFNEYVDMLDDFTNREIVQMARLSRKEGKMPFEHCTCCLSTAKKIILGKNSTISRLKISKRF